MCDPSVAASVLGVVAALMTAVADVSVNGSHREPVKNSHIENANERGRVPEKMMTLHWDTAESAADVPVVLRASETPHWYCQSGTTPLGAVHRI